MLAADRLVYRLGNPGPPHDHIPFIRIVLRAAALMNFLEPILLLRAWIGVRV